MLHLNLNLSRFSVVYFLTPKSEIMRFSLAISPDTLFSVTFLIFSPKLPGSI